MLNNNSLMDEVTPLEFFLSQNYPNPFKESTIIKYCVAYKTRVRITVYNSDRKLIEKLVNEVKEAGTYEVEYSVCHSRESLPNGKAGGNPEGVTYFYRLEAGEYRSEKNMLLLK